MYMRDILLDVIRPVDSSAIHRAAATGRHSQDETGPEGSSPRADTGTAGVGDLLTASYRARIYSHERVIERLHDLIRAERWDDVAALVRDEYRAIHGVG